MNGIWQNGKFVLASTLEDKISRQQHEIEQLRQLVRHCWIHSGYRDCGRAQMESDLRALYDEVKKSDEDES